MARTTPVRIKNVKGLKKRKGASGAAKNYITRNQALKKLQCTLSDFRRLCILKGIYPREPRYRKKAGRGSTAPASFYYSKDITYLLHEPLLEKLREHKAFAKKLSRALGRRDDGLAKNLSETHQGYRIDHIIKERYPTFADSIRDLDDALSLVILFANLPSTVHVSPAVIANCARLNSEWQLYVIKSKALKKVFLSIKGVYYQAQIEGQPVTWLVPYPFTQNVPPDVDFRIMLTFLELYQTLLGFVLYRLYQTVNLLYPPKYDADRDEAGAGMNALTLEGTDQVLLADKTTEGEPVARPTAKRVRNQIKSIISSHSNKCESAEDEHAPQQPLLSLSDHDTTHQGLFQSYNFFLSREVTRPMLEFVIRCAGGQVGWDVTLGAGSPISESDPSITHHVIDRPVLPSSTRQLPQRAFIQPQWVVDCINRSTLLPTEEYGPGKTLPPHLSPFVDNEQVRKQGGYVPELSTIETHRGTSLKVRGQDRDAGETEKDSDEDEKLDEDDQEDHMEQVISQNSAQEPLASGDAPSASPTKSGAGSRPALNAAAANPKDSDLVLAAEVEAEKLGISPDQFQTELKKLRKVLKKIQSGEKDTHKKPKAICVEVDESAKMAEMMLSAKQRKLYHKMSYTKQKRAEERHKLESKRKLINQKRVPKVK